MPELLTVGHGQLDQRALLAALRRADVRRVVDVRRFPGSRAHPHVARAALEAWLTDAGVDYRWEERLGGRRSAVDGDVDAWWTVPAFRAYAAHLRTADAIEAMDLLVAEAGQARTAVMCSESLWWRCHRRLIADVAWLAYGCTVRHVDANGRLRDHQVPPAAALRPDGMVDWRPERA